MPLPFFFLQGQRTISGKGRGGGRCVFKGAGNENTAKEEEEEEVFLPRAVGPRGRERFHAEFSGGSESKEVTPNQCKWSFGFFFLFLLLLLSAFVVFPRGRNAACLPPPDSRRP